MSATTKAKTSSAPIDQRPSPLLTTLLATYNKNSRQPVSLLQDGCFDWNIVGPSGDITAWGDGVHLLATIHTSRPTLWSALVRKAKSLGCKINQSGDTEGSWTFDPSDKAQSRFAFSKLLSKS